jgi:hypothetical protein
MTKGRVGSAAKPQKTKGQSAPEAGLAYPTPKTATSRRTRRRSGVDAGADDHDHDEYKPVKKRSRSEAVVGGELEEELEEDLGSNAESEFDEEDSDEESPVDVNTGVTERSQKSFDNNKDWLRKNGWGHLGPATPIKGKGRSTRGEGRFGLRKSNYVHLDLGDGEEHIIRQKHAKDHRKLVEDFADGLYNVIEGRQEQAKLLSPNAAIYPFSGVAKALKALDFEEIGLRIMDGMKINMMSLSVVDLEVKDVDQMGGFTDADLRSWFVYRAFIV